MTTKDLIKDVLNNKIEQYQRYEDSLRRQLDSIHRREEYIRARALKA